MESNDNANHEAAAENTVNQEENDEQFSELIKQGFAALMPTIRASNTLPKGQQWDLFCTSPLFKPIMDSLGSKSLELMSMIMQHQGMQRDIRKRDLEEKYELIIETNDKILERVGMHLDELSGIRRNPSKTVADIPVSIINKASGSWNKDIAQSAAWREVRLSRTTETPVVLRNARVTQRPQVKFLDKIDNTSTPFEPRIKEKPNALKPLAILYEQLPDEDPCYSHPYEFELDRFQEKIDKLNLAPRTPQNARPIDETPLIMVSQEGQLTEMLRDLQAQTEIAVDLEHHSYRSFQGFTCLMQVSTREKDYLIDTLELRHKLHVLNEVFTDPKIVKVFHGADSDVQWLQRDLSLYVVNMFDTYQAALLLSLPRLSLAYLLKTFCSIDANKHFQLYDWRTRPLAKDAIKYAREDTHYLLYIYDVLWNKLLEKSNGGTQMLQSAIFRSADTCKKRYWKSIFKEDSHEPLYRTSKKNFDNRQMYALKELYAWRDRTAREEDESTGYVLPNHMLLLIAEQLPKEMQGILACCNPVPPLVRQNLVLLHQIILKAREQPLVARVSTTLNVESRLRPPPQTDVNLEGALHCPHDLTHNVDFRDDLPTLLNNMDTSLDASLLEDKSFVSVFEESEEKNERNSLDVSFPNQIHFLSPYERYRKMLKYLEAEENKTEEEREQELARDTQKLLDECMRERLKMTAATASAMSSPDRQIKREDQSQDYNQQSSRKRNRSQDSEISISEDSLLLNSSVKSETSCENIKTEESESKADNPKAKNRKKKKKWNQSNNQPNIQPNNQPKLSHYEMFIAGLQQSNYEEANIKYENEQRDSDQPPTKKRRNNEDSLPMNVGAKKKQFGSNETRVTSSGSFTPYDYSQVDYSQYQSPEVSLTQKKSNNSFKPRGKKKQQNKTFTFARQYGSGSGKKKS